MTLEQFLNKYIIITKRDGKKVEGILIDILGNLNNFEEQATVSLVIRIDEKHYKNVYLVEIDTIGEII